MNSFSDSAYFGSAGANNGGHAFYGNPQDNVLDYGSLHAEYAGTQASYNEPGASTDSYTFGQFPAYPNPEDSGPISSDSEDSTKEPSTPSAGSGSPALSFDQCFDYENYRDGIITGAFPPPPTQEQCIYDFPGPQGVDMGNLNLDLVSDGTGFDSNQQIHFDDEVLNFDLDPLASATQQEQEFVFQSEVRMQKRLRLDEPLSEDSEEEGRFSPVPLAPSPRNGQNNLSFVNNQHAQGTLKKIRCPLVSYGCQGSFNSGNKKDFERHIAKHGIGPVFLCSLCQHASNTDVGIKAHLKTHKNAAPSFRELAGVYPDKLCCPGKECGATFGDFRSAEIGISRSPDVLIEWFTHVCRCRYATMVDDKGHNQVLLNSLLFEWAYQFSFLRCTNGPNGPKFSLTYSAKAGRNGRETDLQAQEMYKKIFSRLRSDNSVSFQSKPVSMPQPIQMTGYSNSRSPIGSESRFIFIDQSGFVPASTPSPAASGPGSDVYWTPPRSEASDMDMDTT